MKYQSSNTKTIYDIDFTVNASGGMFICPECSPMRKKKKDKALKFYPDTCRAYCHHCNATFFEYKPFNNEKQYVVPKWENKTDLSDKAVKWFTGRMISQGTLNKMKIHTKNEWMPQFQKEVETICFPFFQNNILKNVKFRGAKKSFKLVSGAELIWYNFDALIDNKEIIICEGEIDALTWIENGFENVISVPNGAGGNIEYLDNSIELFENIEKIYLSTDNDSQGIKLRDELIRRLGAERCSLINFKHHKDANDYFIQESGLEFKKLIKNAKDIPITGIVKIESFESGILQLYEHGEQPGLKISHPLDDLVTWESSRLLTVTGVPGSGKSEFVDFLTCKLNLIHKWKVAYFTPENYPLKYHYRKIHTKFSGQKFDKKTDTTDFWNIYEYIKSNFFYVMDEENCKVDYVMERAKILVKNHGVKCLVIDPYNKLEHQFDGISETQYISKFLDKLTSFSKFYDVFICLIAHPRKMDRDMVPTLYDISGSANFYNKTDYGITIDRPRNTDTGLMENQVDIHVQKVKFKHLGEQGILDCKYNYINGRFENQTVNNWDYSNWLDLNSKLENNTVAGIEPNENPFEEIDEIPF